MTRWREDGGSSLPAHPDGLRQLDGQPSDAAVVDAPELRLEPLAERDHGAVGMRFEEPLDLEVEAPHAQRLPLRLTACADTEVLLERIVDRVDQLDRLRVLENGIRAACLERAVVERPEQRLRHTF